ncbi:MAG: translocation/assembly module TamB domain-containing protein [Casimicrobiaceae bacterium]
MTSDETPPLPPPPPRRTRVGRYSLAVAVLVVLAIVGAVAFLLSELGLPFVIARVIAQTDGQLTVDGPSGSLAGSMRFRGLAWRGADTTVTATDVVVEWSPRALFSNRLEISGLGARAVSIAVRPSTGATTPPSSLALPMGVSIGNAAVTELTWQTGPRGGKITGLEFGYAGDANEHRLSALKLVSEFGALAGDAKLGAAAPFPLEGSVAITGDGPLAGARLDTRLSGTLSALALEANGTLRDASMKARAAIAPFGASAFEQATVALSNVDLAAYVDALPRTRFALDVDLHPAEGGIAGAFRATNAVPGPFDQQRLPLSTAEGRYSYAGDRLALSGVTATVEGGGRVRGEGAIDLAARDSPSRWRLSVDNLDLSRLSTALAATRLSGKLSADVDGGRQSFTGDLAQASMSVSFAATYAQRRIEVTRMRAEAMGGVVSGSGRIALDAPRAFDVALDAQRFDPSRFGDFPAGTLSGTLKAEGALLPEWKATAALVVAPESQLKGIAIAGSASGSVTPTTLANAKVDLSAGAARLAASGNAGAVNDRLQFRIAVPRLAELAPLVGRWLAKPLGGSVRASGTLRVEPGGIGGDVDAQGEGLAYGDIAAAATLVLKASIEPGGATANAAPLDTRKLSLSAAATKLRARDVALARASASVSGTLARHAGKLAAAGAGIDANAAFDGGLAPGANPAVPASLRWSGRIAELQNRGDVPFALEAPATLSLAAGHVQLQGARLAIADGHATVAEFALDDSRITTRGQFDGVPVESLARLAERPLPLVSTLKLSGAWTIASTPKLNGSFSIGRESGDVFGVQSGATPAPGLAFGLEVLTLDGKLVDDAFDAKLDFRSARVGRAQGTLSLASVAGTSPGHIARTSPLAFALDAELQSLTPLQPWLGTTAVVNGAVKIALTGRGTLQDPILSGTVAGDGLRIDAPPYGIALRDGRVRAHLADGGIDIDEISIAGGEGRFVASGSIASRRSDANVPRTRITWRAEDFRITNRPDLRLVVAGEGTLAIVEKRLDIAGKVRIVDGHIEWERSPPGQLGPDVVVVGRPRPQERDNGIPDLPLALDVDVDLGNRLTFSGSGLDTGLSGRVHVTTAAGGRLIGKGTISTTNGTYFAFGQRLVIDRGRVIFDGPLDNPALDVVALRKNLAVEAGVELTGTAKVPRVRITSNPPVPENEALAWLITGEAPSSGRGDIAALSAASAALLSSDGKPLSTQLAQSIGLDDISLRGGGIGSGSVGPSSSTSSQVIVFGKRITDKLSVGFEQGLSIAANALRIEYALSKTLTLRAEAGTVSGVGIVYRRTFD